MGLKSGLRGFKKRVAWIIFLLTVVSYQLSAVSFAQQTASSAELIENAKQFDGKEIIYQGEAIGEVMTRGNYSWVNLHDGENAIGIWMPNNFLSLISFTGSYNARGDWLEVRGVFNRACKMHGGDLDIHATQLAKIREGRQVKHRLVSEKQSLSIILSGVLICLLILQLLLKRLKKP
ncbi:DNA-binding protein [bacterium]|nr:MAG: DNA-binding protein [bacterium]